MQYNYITGLVCLCVSVFVFLSRDELLLLKLLVLWS